MRPAMKAEFLAAIETNTRAAWQAVAARMRAEATATPTPADSDVPGAVVTAQAGTAEAAADRAVGLGKRLEQQVDLVVCGEGDAHANGPR